MKKELFLYLIYCLLISMEINAQELTAQFIALPSAQPQELNLSTTPQTFSSRASLDQIIKTEIERLQYLGYLSVKTQEREYLSDLGQGILEISFDLGSRWQNIIFSYPEAIESYVQNIKISRTNNALKPELPPPRHPFLSALVVLVLALLDYLGYLVVHLVLLFS